MAGSLHDWLKRRERALPVGGMVKVGKDKVGKDRVGKDKVGKDKVGKDKVGKDNVKVKVKTRLTLIRLEVTNQPSFRGVVG